MAHHPTGNRLAVAALPCCQSSIASRAATSSGSSLLIGSPSRYTLPVFLILTALLSISNTSGYRPHRYAATS
ncbi:hypothetical protein I7I53_03793 [Histoplasma capsulatum var. duboisii H88]|uniref:Uncharacterized protein n=1 Tax=Ajellomyces capsulatus (strain H88) TaxID=544711 RepID=A0A8A1LNE0_AJEC8|nr:hypothetical protein I7I53_03793 [Histoplasma capsulatum var. duboisii H88]